MALTTLSNIINPEVMADMIAAELPQKLRFVNLAQVDNTLVGRAGNTITVPTFAYIGDAEDVAEGQPINLAALTASTIQATVKKAGKGVEVTDEAVLSGHGDPLGEAVRQLTMSIASKVDNDCVEALEDATAIHDGSAAVIGYNGVVAAVDLFQEEDYEPKVILVHPKQVTTLRLDPNFLSLDKYPVPVIMNGVIGQISGCQVVVSKRVKEVAGVFHNAIVKAGALKLYMKREVAVETDRDILKKTTVATADKHFVAYLYDTSKVVLAKFKK